MSSALKNPKPTLQGKARFSEAKEIPFAAIKLDPKRFQGRSGAFSEETVAKIVGQGYDKSEAPIVLWEDESGHSYLLSGHSRYEAASRLIKAGDHELSNIPVKYFLGDFQTAMDYALLESNRASTEEGLLSDLAAYKRALSRGYNKAFLKGVFKPEKRLRLLEQLAFLHEKGKFIEYLSADSSKHFPYLERNAIWVARMRREIPELSHAHEKELFDYLYPLDEKGGASRLQISKAQFFERVNRKISRIDFSFSGPLKLKEQVSTNAFTDPLKEQIKALEKEIDDFNQERSKLDAHLLRAKSKQNQSKTASIQKRQSEINQLIIRILDEKQKLEQSIQKVQNNLSQDLFSQATAKPVPNRNSNNMKLPLSQLLSRDAYFAQHPENILGISVADTDRFGKPMTKVIGTLDQALKKLVKLSPKKKTVLKKEQQKLSPKPIISPKTEAKPKEQKPKKSALKKSLQSSKKSLAQRAMREKLGTKHTKQELFSFQEIVETYNQGISPSEIQVWVWHLQKTGKLPNSGIWDLYTQSEEKIRSKTPLWISQGFLAFSQGELIPSVLYYSGNIYEKLNELEVGKAEIVKHFGTEQYQNQKSRLLNILPDPLKFTGNDSGNQLVINPKSSFAGDFFIEELRDGTKFKRSRRSDGALVKISLSLTDAFSEWLRIIPPGSFKGSTWQEVVRYYLRDARPSSIYSPEEKKRIREKARQQGDRMFAIFLRKGLKIEDQVKITQKWNRVYNGFQPIDYFKIPIGFRCSKTFKNQPLILRKSQREGIAFAQVQGSGCLAYNVGVGKTMTAILSVAAALEEGRAKRPLIVVPNQTYANWKAEISGKYEDGKLLLTGILPHIPLNDYYNMGELFSKVLKSEKISKVPSGSITLMSYEGFNKLGFNADTWENLSMELYGILNQGRETRRELAILYEKTEELMGRAVANTRVNIEDLGFDYLVFDEAHALKKSFTQVKGEVSQKGKRAKAPYEIRSGQPSQIALRGFMISEYIQRMGGGVLLLTATPFTNSPLEIFSMLSLINYKKLKAQGFGNLKNFFDTFIKTSYELIINASFRPERKEIVLGFNNLIAMQKLIFQFIHYKAEDASSMIRPEKLILPLDSTDPKRKVSTFLEMSPLQKELMREVEDYIRGIIKLKDFCLEDKDQADDHLAVEDEDTGRVLRGLGLASQISLSPFLYGCRKFEDISPEKLIQHSPKIAYAMACIESVKSYCEKEGLPMSGQVIYSNSGLSIFPLIRDYLIENLGFKKSEVGIIRGGMSSKQKESVKDRFNAGKIHVLLGTSTIKEGINLQNRSTDLYNLWLDWNPTDMKQLEGRIWRPGNAYPKVRIIYPLLEDSIDIFKFQKLQEKTSRINEIWAQAGQSNSLDLSEFNPAELKRALIRNPEALAELEVSQDRERIMDEIQSLEQNLLILSDTKFWRREFQEIFPRIEKQANVFRPRGKRDRKPETAFSIFREWLDSPQSDALYQDERDYEKGLMAFKRFEVAQRDFLYPKGMDRNFDYQRESQAFKSQVAVLKERLKTDFSQQAMAMRIQAIEKQQATQLRRSQKIPNLVAEFAQLHPEVLVPIHKAVVPPLVDNDDSDGLGKIEMMVAALRRLTEIQETLQQMNAA